MTQIENVSRRGFLKGMAGTSAFVLGVTLAPKSLFAKSNAAGGDVLAGSGTDVLAAGCGGADGEGGDAGGSLFGDR